MSRMTRRFGPRWLSGFATIWPIGILVLIPGFFVLRALGKIEIIGYQRAAETLRRGRVIVAPNHPDGFTPFLMTAVFWKRYLFQPRFCFWNLPREGLVHTAVLRWIMRCILIDRGNNEQKKVAFKEARMVLEQTGNLLVFGEGTRTADPSDPAIEFVEKYGRRIRRFKTRVPLLALAAKAQILPVWIDMPDVTTKLGFWASIKHLLRRGRRLTIVFGQEYPVIRPFNIRDENRKLEEAILGCGIRH